MNLLGLFAAGFASGWVVRGSVDSSRSLVVGALAAAYGLAERAKRFVAIERENLEDLVAEAKARHAASVAASVAPRTNGHASKEHGEYVQ